MGERAHLARFFLLNVVERIEVFHFARESRWKVARVKLRDRPCAALAGHQAAPGRLSRVAERSYQTQASDDDSTFNQDLISWIPLPGKSFSVRVGRRDIPNGLPHHPACESLAPSVSCSALVLLAA